MFDSETAGPLDDRELLAEIHREVTPSEEAALWASIRAAYGSQPWTSAVMWPNDAAGDWPDDGPDEWPDDGIPP